MAAVKKTAAPEGEKSALSRFDQLLASPLVKGARATYGANAMVPAASHPILRRKFRLRTGVYPLDVALGGGLPAGRMTVLYGPPSTGKTTVATQTIAEFQQSCAACYRRIEMCVCPGGVFLEPVVGFVDLEGTLDLEWIASQGVRTDKLLYSAPSTAEEALETTDGLVRSGLCDLIVYDSLALTVPRKTSEERGMGDALPGSMAKIISEGLARITLSQNAVGNRDGRRPTVVFLNQIRNKIGVVFGDPTQQSGGNAPTFMPSCIIRTGGGKVTMEKDELGVEFAARAEWRATIVKNKTAAPRLEAEAFVQLANTAEAMEGDFLDAHKMADDLKRYELLTGGGSSYQLFGVSGSLGELKLKLHQDRVFRAKAYDTLMKIHFEPAVEDTSASVESQPAG